MPWLSQMSKENKNDIIVFDNYKEIISENYKFWYELYVWMNYLNQFPYSLLIL